MNLLDLFSGIGGFHKGLEEAGFKFEWVGHSDIDKYANAVYQHNFKGAKYLGSVTTIQPEDLPKVDIITFGSPCQDFSLAGKRLGMQGDRSSLITEAIRLISACRPSVFIWENVKGTFSSNYGADFWAIIKAFTDIGGYRLEWQLLNTRWFLPQNRERIYLVGYLAKTGGSKIFPIGKNNQWYNEVFLQGEETHINEETISNIEDRVGHPMHIYGKDGQLKNNQTYAACLSRGGHSGGNHSDMDLIADFRNDEGLRVRKDGNSPTLMTVKHSETEPSMMPPLTFKPMRWQRSEEGKEVRRINQQNGKDYTPFSKEHRELVESTEDVSNCITNALNKDTLLGSDSLIRRLTPIECSRLQGFPDDWNEKGILDNEIVEISDTQRYKQLGNAVTVNVVKAVGQKILNNKEIIWT